MFIKGMTAGWRHDFSKERGIIRKIPLEEVLWDEMGTIPEEVQKAALDNLDNGEETED